MTWNRGVALASAVVFLFLGLGQDRSFAQSEGSAAEEEVVLPLSAFQSNDPRVEQAIAVSAPQSGPTRPVLQHPERFGLLGRLVGHGFYRLNGAVLGRVTISAFDNRTIDWREGNSHYYIRNKGVDKFSVSASEKSIENMIGIKFEENDLMQGYATIDYFQIRGYEYRITNYGNIISNYSEWWASANDNSKREIEIEASRLKRELERELEDVNKDIAKKCPGGPNSDDCRDLYRVKDDLIEGVGGDASNSEVARFDAEINAQYKQRHAIVAAQNQAMMGAMVGVMASNLVSKQGARAASVPMPATASAYSPAAPQGAASAPTAAVFGPLPAGIGTPAQRQFWASKCENQRADGSPAAQGCQQTRQMLHAPAPAAPAPTTALAQTAGAPRNPVVGGLTTNGGGGAVMAQASSAPVECVSVANGKHASLHNSCAFTVTVAYCTTTPEAGAVWQCARNGGGMDTIAAGGDMFTAITLGNEDYKGGYDLRWVACRGGLGTGRPILTNQGRKGVCN